MHAAQDALTISVSLHNQGIQFGLSANGSDLLNLLLSDPIPRQHLNNFIFHALHPAMATIGPWRYGYGMQSANLEVSVLVSSGDNGIVFSQLPPSTASSVVIEEISETSLPHTQFLLPSSCRCSD